MLAAAEAIRKAGSTDREAIRKALREVKLMTAYDAVGMPRNPRGAKLYREALARLSHQRERD